MIETDVVIIGAGPAGLHAAFQVGIQGFQSHIIDSLPYLGGQCVTHFADKLIYDIPAIASCTGHELINNLLDQVKPFEPTLHLQKLVTHITPMTTNWGEGEEDLSQPSQFIVTLNDNSCIQAKSIIIAAGAGAFLPRKLKLEGLDLFENKQVLYQLPASLESFANKHIVISGDLEETLQAVNRLTDLIISPMLPNQTPASITLIHRRAKFKAQENTSDITHSHIKHGHLQFWAATPIALHSNKDGKLTHISIKQSSDQQVIEIPADFFFILHGVSAQPENFDGLNLARINNLLQVNTEKFQTNIPGIFAIGDAIHYSGKRKLIISAFHEAALASYAVAEYIQGGISVPQIYTSSNTKLQSSLKKSF